MSVQPWPFQKRSGSPDKEPALHCFAVRSDTSAGVRAASVFALDVDGSRPLELERCNRIRFISRRYVWSK